MSKKQAIINKFFQPKVKDYVLSSQPLRVKPRSFVRTNRISGNVDKCVDKSTTVISLLSSDEDDETSNEPAEKDSSNSKQAESISKTEGTKRLSVLPDSVLFNRHEDVMGRDVVRQKDGKSAEVTKNAPKEELTDYKWSSFTAMIDFVLNDRSNYHLLNDDDWTIVENFKAMSGKMLPRNAPSQLTNPIFFFFFAVDSQRLYVRLYVRKHRWIRSSKIVYPELGEDLGSMFDELVTRRLLLPCNNQTILDAY